MVSLHVLCMFLPAPLAGWLVDRTGPSLLAGISAALFVAAGVAGYVADPHSAAAFVLALALLGLGWSAGIVAGSTMLMAAVAPDGRLRAEGAGEVAMGLAAAVGTPVAGVVVAASGFSVVAAAGGVVAILVAMPLMRSVARGVARR